MVEYILSFISVSNILALPPIVLWPGLLVLLLLLVRAVRSILSLSVFRFISSIIMFVVVAFILSRFGFAIYTLIETPAAPPS